mmetsp:Transcript_6024/g.9583  ORF Transcript_6024/g.9583 Transcript_6024/m.9583 type:complete len:83 (+) Transcript_6024:375-623(+)
MSCCGAEEAVSLCGREAWRDCEIKSHVPCGELAEDLRRRRAQTRVSGFSGSWLTFHSFVLRSDAAGAFPLFDRFEHQNLIWC